MQAIEDENTFVIFLVPSLHSNVDWNRILEKYKKYQDIYIFKS